MPLTGELLIGDRDHAGGEPIHHAVDPSTRESLPPAFATASRDDVDAACRLADDAFDAYRATTSEARAVFLETIAAGIEAIAPSLVVRAMSESGLPKGRLDGELGRTTGQLRLFAQVLRAGHWQQLVLDTPLPDRKPAARSDLRQRQVAIGPVAVFGASNFPLAFSVAGGDTAAALAAGCPVVVKAHPSHPGTSELVGRAVRDAVRRCGLHEGVFSMVGGVGNEVGAALVAHPAIQAVGFTGSRAGGMALVRIAQSRAQPIPVHAEMSAINPVFVLPAALGARGDAIARGFVDSLTLGSGQFCTNPGLLLGITGPDWERFVERVKQAVSARPAGTMLNEGIHRAYVSSTAERESMPGVHRLARGEPDTTSGYAARAFIDRTTALHWLATPALEDEVFGPSSLLVECADADEMRAIAARMPGQLTATLHIDPADHDMASGLIDTLERKVGRILANGFPTGVEVGYAMVHGGPFPATSDARGTSVGASAINRFLRPVCYQDIPDALLPVAMRDESLPSQWRLVDGTLLGPR